MKDLKKYRKIPEFLHSNKHVFGLYPRLVSAAAQTWFRVDGADKLTKEKEILRSFRRAGRCRALSVMHSSWRGHGDDRHGRDRVLGAKVEEKLFQNRYLVDAGRRISRFARTILRRRRCAHSPIPAGGLLQSQ